MYRRLAIVPLALLALASCGTPEPAATLGQAQPTAAPPAECKAPISSPGPGTPLATATPFAYPGPGTPFPTSPPPTPILTIDPQTIPEQTAPLGLATAPRIDDQAAMLGAFMEMPRRVAGHELEVAHIGPYLIDRDAMYLGYGRRSEPSMLGPSLIELHALRSYGGGLRYLLDWPLRRDGQVVWAERYREEQSPNQFSVNGCDPVVELIWTTTTSEIVFIIRSDSVARRDLLLRAYLDTLKTAPPMRPLEPLLSDRRTTPYPAPSTPTITPTP